MDKKLGGAEEPGDINGSNVTTEGSSPRSDSNGSESRFWQDDDSDYRYDDDTELHAECKCEPQLAEKESLTSDAAVDSTKPEATSELPADASDAGELLQSRPGVGETDNDSSILSAAAPAISNHMNQVNIVIRFSLPYPSFSYDIPF